MEINNTNITRYSTEDRARYNVGVFEYALLSLEKALTLNVEEELVADLIEARFKMTYNTCVRATQSTLLLSGYTVTSDTSVFKTLMALGWTTEDSLYQQLLMDRNFTTQEYDEDYVSGVESRIRGEYSEWFRFLLEKLKDRLK